jgi:pimeloyl-ACP methyl ester carboxylesterase
MEKRQVVLKNGEVYHYLEQGQGDTTIILIHGNFSSSLYYTPLLNRLPKNVKVLTPDLRGFGDSSYYRRFKSLSELAEDIYLFMQAKGVEKAHIAGWSLGGGVALEFAANHPEATDKVVLINASTHRGYPIFKKDKNGKAQVGQAYLSADEMGEDVVQVKPILEAQKQGNFDFISMIFSKTIYTVNKPSKEDNELWINESLKQRNLVDADWALANQNMSSSHNFYNAGTNQISKVKAEILHTWGKQDITVPQYMVLDNYNALKAQSQLVVYEDCGHSPLVDVPDLLANDMIKFFNL